MKIMTIKYDIIFINHLIVPKLFFKCSINLRSCHPPDLIYNLMEIAGRHKCSTTQRTKNISVLKNIPFNSKESNHSWLHRIIHFTLVIYLNLTAICPCVDLKKNYVLYTFRLWGFKYQEMLLNIRERHVSIIDYLTSMLSLFLLLIGTFIQCFT